MFRWCLDRPTCPVHQVLRLGRGAITELDATEDAVEVKELLPRAGRTLIRPPVSF